MLHRRVDEISICRLVNLFLRAFVVVSCVAANTRQIATGRYGGAVCCGFLISFLWWRNAGRASEDRSTVAAVAYGLGAAAGTALGMWLAR